MKKSEYMRKIYGEHDGTCKGCCNIIRREWGRNYIKCIAYGVSQSEATDWVLRSPACGLYGVPFDEDQLTAMQIKKHERTDKTWEPIKGQMDMFGRIV